MSDSLISIAEDPIEAKDNIFHPILYVFIINLFIILLTFIVFLLPASYSDAISVHFPKTLTSDLIPGRSQTIFITGEDVIYYNNKILTVLELKNGLLHSSNTKQPLLIKADGRSSLNRIIEVWNTCKALGFEKVNLATMNIQ